MGAASAVVCSTVGSGEVGSGAGVSDAIWTLGVGLGVGLMLVDEGVGLGLALVLVTSGLGALAGA